MCNLVIFHPRDENGKILPCIDGPSFDAITQHDAAVVRVMQDKGVSQEAAERLLWEHEQIAGLRMRLTEQQRFEVVDDRGRPLSEPNQVSGLTDEQIDREAEILQKRLIESR